MKLIGGVFLLLTIINLSLLVFADGGPVIESNTDNLGLFSWLILFSSMIFLSGFFKTSRPFILLLGLLSSIFLFTFDFPFIYLGSSILAFFIGIIFEKQIKKITDYDSRNTKEKAALFLILLLSLILSQMNTYKTYDCGEEWRHVKYYGGDGGIELIYTCYPTTPFSSLLGSRHSEQDFYPKIKDGIVNATLVNKEDAPIEIKQVGANSPDSVCNDDYLECNITWMPCNTSFSQYNQTIDKNQNFSIEIQCPIEGGDINYYVEPRLEINYSVFTRDDGGSVTEISGYSWSTEFMVFWKNYSR